jgi:hypothetical protein
LRRLARRLYRRAARGWAWERIAEAERGEQPDWVSSQAVRGTVAEWARRLDIPLPERPAGRPREKR